MTLIQVHPRNADALLRITRPEWARANDSVQAAVRTVWRREFQHRTAVAPKTLPVMIESVERAARNALLAHAVQTMRGGQ